MVRVEESQTSGFFVITVLAIWQFSGAGPFQTGWCHFEKGQLKETSRSNSYMGTIVLAGFGIKCSAVGPAEQHDLYNKQKNKQRNQSIQNLK